MIELHSNALVFRFPQVHERAVLHIDFQRTLRIPDDDRDYPLPAGLGRFPLRHVDDYAEAVPERWIEHGGIMLPMYQSEALWINFSSPYPFAVKVATGKTNAVTGKEWEDGLRRGPQDYVVVPEQPWLDGYCVEQGIIRQFVAMPLGAGYSAEEQITGAAEHGGIQIVAYPMKRRAYERLQRSRSMFVDLGRAPAEMDFSASLVSCMDMGLSPGGRMRQEIYDDPHRLDDWETHHRSRCFVHIANSLVWRALTGESPPTVPPTAKEYRKAGIPWFEFYAEDAKVLDGSSALAKLKSVAQLGKAKGDVPYAENESMKIDAIVELRRGLKKGQVREGMF